VISGGAHCQIPDCDANTVGCGACIRRVGELEYASPGACDQMGRGVVEPRRGKSLRKCICRRCKSLRTRICGSRGGTCPRQRKSSRKRICGRCKSSRKRVCGRCKSSRKRVCGRGSRRGTIPRQRKSLRKRICGRGRSRGGAASGAGPRQRKSSRITKSSRSSIRHAPQLQPVDLIIPYSGAVESTIELEAFQVRIRVCSSLP
jgi:hypothetical protein